METQELKFAVNSLGETKTLSQIPTRQLIKILRVYRSMFYYDDYGLETYTQTEYILEALAAIKAELATREHIPNRRESKLLRQKNAKKFRGTRSKNKSASMG